MDPYLPTMLAVNMTTNIVLLISIVLLLFCSAFFSGSETAFTTVSNLRFRTLAENKVKGARKAVYISENYKKTLTTENIMATHSSILAWKMPWTKEPGRLWSMGSHRIRQD